MGEGMRVGEGERQGQGGREEQGERERTRGRAGEKRERKRYSEERVGIVREGERR